MNEDINNNCTRNNRIVYIDQLRTISIIWLILINVSFAFRYQNTATLEEYVLFTSFAFGVPVFLMLLGELMLKRDYSDIHGFITKRFVRILYPFLLLNTLMTIVLMTVNYPQMGLNMDTLVYFMQTFMKQHWYAWMLLGIYLSLPILSEFIRSWHVKGAAYYLALAIPASLIYQALAYFNTPSYFNLTFFIGPLIYLFAGYYFENKKFNISANNMVKIGLALFIISTLIIAYNAIVINKLTFTILLHHYNFYTHSYLDVSVIVLAQAVGVFLVFKYINQDVTGTCLKIKNFLLNKWILKPTTEISRSCYGIYLIHQTIITILTVLLDLNAENEAYGIPIITIVTLIISFTIIYGLNKYVLPSQVIGYD